MTKPRWWNPIERPNWWGCGLCLSCIVLLPISVPLAMTAGVAGGALLLRERAREMGWGNLILVFCLLFGLGMAAQYLYS